MKLCRFVVCCHLFFLSQFPCKIFEPDLLERICSQDPWWIQDGCLDAQCSAKSPSVFQFSRIIDLGQRSVFQCSGIGNRLRLRSYPTLRLCSTAFTQISTQTFYGFFSRYDSLIYDCSHKPFPVFNGVLSELIQI
jgi:hypothetical protein